MFNLKKLSYSKLGLSGVEKSIYGFLILSFCTFSKLSALDVLFKVNMNQKFNQGLFNPATDFVDLAGTFNGWGSPANSMSDNDGDLIYEALVSGFNQGDIIEFKFRINGSWSGTEEFPNGGPNRRFTVQGNNNIIEVWYSDELPSDADPEARFITGTTTVLNNALVSYQNISIGSYDRVEWYFEGGEPSFSSVNNPIISYSETGVYDVQLITYKDNFSDTSYVTDYLTVIERDKSQLEWWNESVFYEIFVRSFYDSDGDGIGDFKGMEDKLDYLNDGDATTTDDLGITGIWLMPIQHSPSYHGYDVQDYKTVESDYGTMDEFKSFLAAAHERGIKVIIDYVMNHSSRDHPWFIESRNNLNSPKRDWYVWEDNNPGTTGPWGQQVWHQYAGDYYYGLFWGGMPDLNYNSQELQEEMFDIADFWLNDIGVDGFRLDAVRYLYEVDGIVEDTEETISFWKDYTNRIKAMKGDAFSVGESWTSTDKVVKYVENEGLDMCFEFGLSSAIIDAVNIGRSDFLYQKIQEVVDVYPHFQFANFISNHDQNRSIETFGNNVNKAKVAASILLALPGVPFMYYGEEIGMKGRKPDELIRRPMQWSSSSNAGFSAVNPWISLNTNYPEYNVETMSGNAESLLSHYRNLINIRNKNKALSLGDFYPVFSDNNKILAFIRAYENENYLVIQNLSSQSVENINLDYSYTDVTDLKYATNDLLNGETNVVDVTSGMSTMTEIGPYQTRILPLKNTTSVEITEVEGYVNVYPNPSKGIINISLDGAYDVLEVFDVRGILVYNNRDLFNYPKGLEIDLSYLSSGLYFIKIYKKERQEFIVKKLYVE